MGHVPDLTCLHILEITTIEPVIFILVVKHADHSAKEVDIPL